jgi:hypothetical protein
LTEGASPERIDRRERADPPGWRPVPDPTSLTTAALEREVAVLREIIEQQISSLSDLLDVQLTNVRREIGEQRTHYDVVLSERDTRYEERFAASQLAVAAAFEASEKAVASALEAREKAIAAAFEASEKAVGAAFESAALAINKAEISIEKRADATYVALGELQRLLGALMPRAEAEGRFTSSLDSLNEIRKTYDSSLALLSDRVKGLEARGQGKAESQFDMRAWMVALVALVGLAVTIAVAFGGRT